MGGNFLKICILLCAAGHILAARKPKIFAITSEGYPDEFDTSPFVKVGNKLYYFGQSKLSWYNAHLICRSLGGYLASFDNRQDLTDLSNHLKNNYSTARWWWLAGTDLQAEGDFYWYSTGKRITYANWSGRQPDNAGGHENCVHLWYRNNEFKMNDWMCNQAAFYICEATTVLADKDKPILVSIF